MSTTQSVLVEGTPQGLQLCDTAGMLRQHQFEKVEMVSITDAANGLAEHDRMTKCAEAVLEALDLPYRTVGPAEKAPPQPLHGHM